MSPGASCGHDPTERGDAPERHAFERNFVREWKSTEGTYPFATKCMFGSDHHMPRMVKHAAELLHYFRLDRLSENSERYGVEHLAPVSARVEYRKELA